METFPSYYAMVANARMMELGEKKNEDSQKKRKRGFGGGLSG